MGFIKKENDRRDLFQFCAVFVRVVQIDNSARFRAERSGTVQEDTRITATTDQELIVNGIVPDTPHPKQSTFPNFRPK